MVLAKHAKQLQGSSMKLILTGISGYTVICQSIKEQIIHHLVQGFKLTI